MLGFSKAHLKALCWIFIPICSLVSFVTLSIGTAIRPLLGPYCIMLDSTWSNGFTEFSLRVTIFATVLLGFVTLAQVMAKRWGWSKEGKLIWWVVGWIIWPICGLLSYAGSIG